MPAFGRPTRPASAISFSRSQSVRSTPSWPGIGVARRLVGRGLEAQVAPAAVAAARQQHALAGPRQVGDQRLAVLLEDLGADRHPQHHVVGALAGALLAHAGLAVPGEEMLLVAVVDQRVQPLDRLGPDVAALAAVAAVGAAELDELLAAEADAAVAAARRSAPRRGRGRGTSRAAPERAAVAEGRHHRRRAPANRSPRRPRRRSPRASAPAPRPGLSWKTSATSSRQPVAARGRPGPRRPRWRSRCSRRPAPPSSRSRRRRLAARLQPDHADQAVLVVGAGVERPGELARTPGERMRSTKASAAPGG